MFLIRTDTRHYSLAFTVWLETLPRQTLINTTFNPEQNSCSKVPHDLAKVNSAKKMCRNWHWRLSSFRKWYFRKYVQYINAYHVASFCACCKICFSLLCCCFLSQIPPLPPPQWMLGNTHKIYETVTSAGCTFPRSLSFPQLRLSTEPLPTSSNIAFFDEQFEGFF